MTRLSVIVPASNSPSTLDRCLAALRDRVEDGDELVVVTEPSDAVPARLRNLGVASATGDVLVFVDADVAVHPDALERIRAAFTGDPGLHALFGSYDAEPDSVTLVSEFRNLLHHHVHHSSAGEAGTFWTGLGAVRRDVFHETGGFDERIESMEDVDLGMRLATAGRRTLLDPSIQGKHLKHWTFWSMVRTDFKGRAIPWIVLLLRHRSSAGALNLGWRHRVSALTSLVGTLALARRRPRLLAACGAILIALNKEFYGLLFRRRGLKATVTGVGLHAVHHVVGLAAVPFGVLRYLRERRVGDG